MPRKRSSSASAPEDNDRRTATTSTAIIVQNRNKKLKPQQQLKDKTKTDDGWLTTGSSYIGQTVRRVIPVPFHYLIGAPIHVSVTTAPTAATNTTITDAATTANTTATTTATTTAPTGGETENVIPVITSITTTTTAAPTITCAPPPQPPHPSTSASELSKNNIKLLLSDGIVIAHKPAGTGELQATNNVRERTPDLFRILYPAPAVVATATTTTTSSSSFSNTRAESSTIMPRYTEDVTLSELKTALSRAKKSLHFESLSSSATSTTATAGGGEVLTHNELELEIQKTQSYHSIQTQRYNTVLQTRCNEIISQLIVIATFELQHELVLKERYDALVLKIQRQQQQSQGGGGKRGRGMSRSNNRNSRGAEDEDAVVNCPRYYTQNPNSYMIPPTLELPSSTSTSSTAKQDEEGSSQQQQQQQQQDGKEETLAKTIGVSPSQIGQRMKLGISTAHEYVRKVRERKRQYEEIMELARKAKEQQEREAMFFAPAIPADDGDDDGAAATTTTTTTTTIKSVSNTGGNKDAHNTSPVNDVKAAADANDKQQQEQGRKNQIDNDAILAAADEIGQRRRSTRQMNQRQIQLQQQLLLASATATNGESNANQNLLDVIELPKELEKGGRVALCLLELLDLLPSSSLSLSLSKQQQQQHSERNDEEHDDKKKKKKRKDEEKVENTAKRKEKTSKVEKEAMKEDDVSISDDDSTTATDTTSSSDSSEDDSSSTSSSSSSSASSSSSSSSEEEEEEQDEDGLADNPYYEPTSHETMEYLARMSRKSGITPADIQNAICSVVEGTLMEEEEGGGGKKKKNGVGIVTPKFMLEEEEGEKGKDVDDGSNKEGFGGKKKKDSDDLERGRGNENDDEKVHKGKPPTEEFKDANANDNTMKEEVVGEEVKEREEKSSSSSSIIEAVPRMSKLICTTGDKPSDLPQYEPSSFARCKFAVHTYVPENVHDDESDHEEDEEEGSESEEDERDVKNEEEIRKKKEEERLRRKEEAKMERLRLKELAEEELRKKEVIFKSKKSFAMWRYRGITTGYCLWPHWDLTVRELLRRKLLHEQENDACEKKDEKSIESQPRLGHNKDTDIATNGEQMTDIESKTEVGEAAIKSKESTTPKARDNTTNVDETKIDLTDQEEADRAFAQSLASSATDVDGAAVMGAGATRRTTRRAAAGGGPALASSAALSSVGGGGGLTGPIYYGTNTSLTSSQLMSTLYRLLVQQSLSSLSILGVRGVGYMSLMDMKRLVAEDFERGNEIKRIRVALGKLLWKRGKIGRICVGTGVNGLGDVALLKRFFTRRPDGNVGRLITFASASPGFEMTAPATASSSDAGLGRKLDVVTAASAKDTTNTETSKEQIGGIQTTGRDKKQSAMNGEPIEADECVVSATQTASTIQESDDREGQAHSQQHQEMDKRCLDVLETYIRGLHVTEVLLRALVLAALKRAQLPLSVVALAADERPGDVEGMDSEVFQPKSDEDDGEDTDEEGKGIEWLRNGHSLLGSLIYRPVPAAPSSENINAVALGPCGWYRIEEYTPSVPLPPLDGETKQFSAGAVSVSATSAAAPSSASVFSPLIGEGKENTIVERRVRFRAVPTSSSGHNDENGESFEGKGKLQNDSNHTEEEDVGESIVLTEAQVRAGLAAAEIQRNTRRRSRTTGSERVGIGHPFGHEKLGSRIMLTPVLKGEGGNDLQIKPSRMEKDKECTRTYGTVVGHDTIVVAKGDTETTPHVDYRILFLPDCTEDEEHDRDESIVSVGGVEHADTTRMKTEEKVSDGNISDADRKPAHGMLSSSRAFWTSVQASLDGSFTCDIHHNGSSATTYKINLYDYHPSSPAFQACVSIIQYLRDNPKSIPFMEPVDPVKLNIPNYFEIIKHPMDISTLSSNLEKGMYSNDLPPPSASRLGPVEIMLNGPFKDDLLLIFDNAMTFNAKGSWIYNDAAFLKRNVVRKIESIVSSFWSGAGTISSASTGKRNKKKSIYVDEDSDVDMYEYESDYDDDEDNRRSRGRGRKRKAGGISGGSSSKGGSTEDYATKAIEAPVRAPSTLTSMGPFADLPINTNVAGYSLPEEWICIRKPPEKEHKEQSENKEQLREMEMLLRMQSEMEQSSRGGLRRSSRAHTADQREDDENDTIAKISATSNVKDVEFFIPEEFTPPLPMNEIEPTADDEEEDQFVDATTSSRAGVESVREFMHEKYYTKLYHKYSDYLQAETVTSSLNDTTQKVGGADPKYGAYANGFFPPYLGRVIPTTTDISPIFPIQADDSDLMQSVMWEIRPPYVLPALRWVINGLVKSGHLSEVEPLAIGSSDSSAYSSGVIITNHVYYFSDTFVPYDILDAKEMQKRKRLNNAEASSEESEQEVEMSEYEKLRAERVARNAERLKALGLA